MIDTALGVLDVGEGLADGIRREEQLGYHPDYTPKESTDRWGEGGDCEEQWGNHIWRWQAPVLHMCSGVFGLQEIVVPAAAGRIGQQADLREAERKGGIAVEEKQLDLEEHVGHCQVEDLEVFVADIVAVVAAAAPAVEQEAAE